MSSTNSALYKTIYETEARIEELEKLLDYLENQELWNVEVNKYRQIHPADALNTLIPTKHLRVLIPLVKKELESL